MVKDDPHNVKVGSVPGGLPGGRHPDHDDPAPLEWPDKVDGGIVTPGRGQLPGEGDIKASLYCPSPTSLSLWQT